MFLCPLTMLACAAAGTVNNFRAFWGRTSGERARRGRREPPRVPAPSAHERPGRLKARGRGRPGAVPSRASPTAAPGSAGERREVPSSAERSRVQPNAASGSGGAARGADPPSADPAGTDPPSADLPGSDPPGAGTVGHGGDPSARAAL